MLEVLLSVCLWSQCMIIGLKYDLHLEFKVYNCCQTSPSDNYEAGILRTGWTYSKSFIIEAAANSTTLLELFPNCIRIWLQRMQQLNVGANSGQAK